MSQLELRRRSHELANARSELERLKSALSQARKDLAKIKRQLRKPGVKNGRQPARRKQRLRR